MAATFIDECQRKNIFPTGLGASPCTKPIWDSSESSSQAEPFITNRPCSPSTPNVHCHRVHSISYFRQQMQRCISFPIPGNRCRTSGLYNCAVSPALGRTSSTHSFISFPDVHPVSRLTVMSPVCTTPSSYQQISRSIRFLNWWQSLHPIMASGEGTIVLL